MSTVANLSAVWCGLATIVASLSASRVALEGTLRDAVGKSLDGSIMVTRMTPQIRVRAKTPRGVIEEYTVVASRQELQLTLRVP